MPYEIQVGPNPGIMMMRIFDNLDASAMSCDAELCLNEGRPIYVMLDVSQMSVGMPENFLEGARNSFFINPNLVHMALYSESNVLNSIAKMVAKLTNRQERMSIHNTRQAAIDHIIAMQNAMGGLPR